MSENLCLGTITEAANRTRLNPRTIRRYIAAGELAGYRIGKRAIRVDLNEVDALLRRIPSAQDVA